MLRSSRHILRRAKTTLRGKTLLLIVIACQILCFAYFFSYKVVDVHNSIDGSWQFTLSDARNSPGDLGNEILYTYGPLFERLAVYPMPADGVPTFLLTVLLFVIILAGGIVSMLSFWRRYVSKNQLLAGVLAIFAVYLLLTITQLDSLFYLSLLVTILAVRRERNPWLRATMLLGLALFSFYKVSFSITFLAILPAAFIVSLKLSHLKRALLYWMTSVAGYMALFVIVTGGSVTTFIQYVHVGIQNSVAYNEFMSLSFAENKQIVIAFALVYFMSVLLCAGLFAYLCKKGAWRKDTVFVAGLIFFVSFFVFKQSVVRSDDHLLAFTPFLPLLLLAPMLLVVTLRKTFLTRRLPLTLLFGLLCVICLAGHVGLQKTLQHKSFGQFAAQRATFFADSVRKSPFSYPAFLAAKTQLTSDLAEREPEIAAIKNELSTRYPGKPIIVYGNTTILSYFLKDGREAMQAPFVQNYAAFPPQTFDQRYIDFLQAHPDALIFLEETEASINERVPAHELNNFFMYLANNYRQVYRNPAGTQFILQKIDTREETCQAYSSVEHRKDLPLAIPQPELAPNQYLKMKIDLPLNLTEVATSMLLKSPVYHLALINQDGGSMIRRTTPSILAHGIAVKPSYMSYRALSDGADFGLKHITINGGIAKQATYLATFEVCTF